MTTIKKDFVELVAFLEANKGKKVSTILEEFTGMCAAKNNAKNFQKDEEGNVTHVFCYYHKQWEAVSDHAYGAKKGTATGLNSMCKEGVNQWSKQQRDAKKSKDELLQSVATGETPADELTTKLEEIEAARNAIVPSSVIAAE
jgi:hypothetical protein